MIKKGIFWILSEIRPQVNKNPPGRSLGDERVGGLEDHIDSSIFQLATSLEKIGSPANND
ncbi:hypothetical protein A2996_01295 [Candidatus Campbellbacteria bacterium RIFCSPLOWO2_01_FULL_34_15]|uniref:Uncharacterized protein n=2 Tax=Candidatus Campbelliibacteriota TaxID=1752727 RepID=A0A1F5EPD4_9BACT|nr:MAG: hypothetical protein A2811_01945 [Candidatus Campbellbacteria bacterium RIFCSPHIGHO2_01_FULL_34_10]OGD69235.1 MAG: hypothetical protein A2996_01295 [Candidatus Campbellbacteria bacterium RIFCSPLOWO2_01_FULL_34_15]